MSSIREEKDYMAGAIRYIRFSTDYDKFDERKEKNRAISRHKGVLKYLKKQREIPSKEDAEHDEDKLNIYEGKAKACNFLTTSLTDIPLGLIRKRDENEHEVWKAIIDKYEVSDQKQEVLNEVTKIGGTIAG